MMDNFDVLTHKNFKLYAAKMYNNPECLDVNEFKQDLNRFKYLKRLLKRYELTGDLQERLILNHIIVLTNVFGNEAAATLLLFKIEREYWSVLKTFLQYLNVVKEDELPAVNINKTLLSSLEKL